FHAMVHLMKHFPEHITFVHRPMPHIHPQLVEEYANQRTPKSTQSGEVNKLICCEVSIPYQRKVTGQVKENNKKYKPFELPILYCGKWASGEQRFPDHKPCINGNDDHTNGVQ